MHHVPDKIKSFNFDHIDRAVVPSWYAAYVRSRYEKKVAEQFHKREIEHFLPLISRLRQWKDRKKLLDLPLFPGYIFTRIALNSRLKVITADGVIRLVGFSGRPTPIPQRQIEDIRRLLSFPEAIEPAVYMNEGDCVKIIYGPLAGIQGRLIERHGKRRIQVGIDLIQCAISVEVDCRWVKPLGTTTQITTP